MRVKSGSTLYNIYSNHLGSVVGMTNATGGIIANSLTRYDPFGNYRTKPAASVNPAISDRGFTGHRQNNTGANDLGLIYMNARYYLPEIGRFISADTIVPEPEEPQSFNRYSYANNSPVNFTDPTGHCINNYEIGSEDMDTCVAGWNAVTNYLMAAAYGPGGSGSVPNELVNDWLLNADIGTLENLMEVMGIGYGYTWTPPQGYTASGWRGGNELRSPEARTEVCDYWQSCYQPATDYYIFTVKLLGPVTLRVIWDDFGNLYIGGQASTYPGASLFRGDANIASGDAMLDIGELPVNLREAALQESLVGPGAGFSGGWKGLGGSWSGNPNGDRFYEVGIATRGLSADLSYTFLVFDSGNTSR